MYYEWVMNGKWNIDIIIVTISATILCFYSYSFHTIYFNDNSAKILPEASKVVTSSGDNKKLEVVYRENK
jgi:hypothetical protein